jgi:hypothetical protein
MIPKNESPDGFAGKYIPRLMGMLNQAKSVKAEMLIPREVRLNNRNPVERSGRT